ncbi:hypothetical protein J4411_01745 [Candidatus Pacearchaeota archaeon]|nr:hypothetical protein [Candidatus Pacearchaeota archaeon]
MKKINITTEFKQMATSLFGGFSGALIALGVYAKFNFWQMSLIVLWILTLGTAFLIVVALSKGVEK